MKSILLNVLIMSFSSLSLIHASEQKEDTIPYSALKEDVRHNLITAKDIDIYFARIEAKKQLRPIIQSIDQDPSIELAIKIKYPNTLASDMRYLAELEKMARIQQACTKKIKEYDPEIDDLSLKRMIKREITFFNKEKQNTYCCTVQ